MKQKKYDILKLTVLAVILIACIARGIPDSILGAAWPSIRSDLALPDTRLGILMLIIASFIILTNLFGTKFLEKIPAEIVTTGSITAIAVSFFFFTRVSSFTGMCLLCVPIGIAVGMMEQALNNFVALHYEPKYMNYLHCFIGLGIICSPYLMSAALSGDTWRSGFFTVFIIEAAAAVLMVPTFPLWKRAKTERNAEEETDAHETVPFYRLLKLRSMRMMVTALFLTNVIEYTCGTWGCTYMVEAKHFSEAQAAKYITVFYIGMTVGRFTAGLIAGKVSAAKRIAVMTMIAAAGAVLIILPLPEALTAAALFLIGLGNGPIYPNLISLTPSVFGRTLTGSAMGVEIAAAYSAVMLTPVLYSFVKTYLQNTAFVLFLFVSIVFMAVASVGLFAGIKQAEHGDRGN